MQAASSLASSGAQTQDVRRDKMARQTLGGIWKKRRGSGSRGWVGWGTSFIGLQLQRWAKVCCAYLSFLSYRQFPKSRLGKRAGTTTTTTTAATAAAAVTVAQTTLRPLQTTPSPPRRRRKRQRARERNRTRPHLHLFIHSPLRMTPGLGWFPRKERNQAVQSRIGEKVHWRPIGKWVENRSRSSINNPHWVSEVKTLVAIFS